jgi:heat shock protein HtpX
MTWFRRIAFFLGLNIVVMLTISLVLNVLGVGPYLTANGLNIGALMAFCLAWGMGGAFISLMISKMMAKWMMGVKIIDPQTANPQQRALLETVYRLARAAGLNKMPEVGIYESPEVNAFATGPTKNNSLVAVSSGLLYNMEGRALDGVLGHEITHIANGDMVTMTLIQGVVNAFVMALARIVAFAIDNALRGDRDSRGGGLGRFGYMMVVWVLEMLFFIPGSMVIGYFSRQREFRADQGGARFAGRDSMISALKNLQRMAQVNAAPAGAQTSAAFSNMKIASDKKGGLISLMATHPPLEERIARLERGV